MRGQTRGSMPINSWTDENVATLTKMWADGHSVTRIALAMDVSRGKVMGKISRLDLPEPSRKLPVIIDHSYRKQCTEIDWAARQARQRQHERAYQARQALKRKQEVRQTLVARGFSKGSLDYRKHLPQMPEMSKAQLRAMLAQAVQNTAAL